jgi:uncharacterized protein YbaP (TraB family)
MKHLIFNFFSSILITQCFAQIPTEKTLLWQISNNTTTKPSYLYGTIHLICPDKIAIDTVIKKAFNNSTQLFLEIDLDDPQMMAKAMKGMMMPDSISLEKLVGKTNYDSMNIIFKSKAGIPLNVMGKAKPMLLMSAIFPALLQCNPDGFEKHFQAMAKERHMPLNGLETIDYQMRVFDTIPYSVQADMLKSLLFNLDSTKKGFDEMLTVYLSKDVNGMQQLTVKDKDFGKYDALMLKNRNNNWIPVIAKEMAKEPTFFAVGAAHLGGINGVINLLRQNGFKVEPVYY